MWWLGKLLYWVAVVAIAAALTYGLVRLAEGLDASEVERATGATVPPLRLGERGGAR